METVVRGVFGNYVAVERAPVSLVRSKVFTKPLVMLFLVGRNFKVFAISRVSRVLYSAGHVEQAEVIKHHHKTGPLIIGDRMRGNSF